MLIAPFNFSYLCSMSILFSLNADSRRKMNGKMVIPLILVFRRRRKLKIIIEQRYEKLKGAIITMI
jgi:hypothetical protein